MEKHVLILSDFVGYGNVAMATSRAVLTQMGCTVFCLPTALISNTWNFGSCTVLDTTDYLRSALENWELLGFRLDAVLIGYIADARQAAFLGEKCRKWHDAGIRVYLDPIFADNGKLYRGITEERLDFLRALLAQVDCVLPNETEARFLARKETAAEALHTLMGMTSGSIVITGIPEDEKNAVLLWDGERETKLTYIPVPGHYPGAGDAFTALYLGGILTGNDPAASAFQSIATAKDWILRSVSSGWEEMGLPVERYL